MRLKGSIAEIGRFFERFVLAAWGLAGGLALAQFPQFLAQYLQRLGGHIDEAGLAAKLYALPELSSRAAKLAMGLRAIEEAGPLTRLPVFLLNAQWSIARQALHHYTPGMTFTSEEVCYLAAGALLGLAVYGGVKTILRGLGTAGRGIWRRIRRNGQTPPGAKGDSASISG